MTTQVLFRLIAFLAGALLALMIFLNGELARHTSSTHASLVAHGVGTLFAYVLWGALRHPKQNRWWPVSKDTPWSGYLAGIPGAFTVILASITVNSEVGFAGTIALIILGQVSFGILVDMLGWFGMKRRFFNLNDLAQIVFTMTGTGILLFLTR